MWHIGGGWWVGIAVMAVSMILVWAGIIALVVWGIRKVTRTGITPSPPGNNPLEIARERYARGDITRTEFERLKRDIS